MRGSTWELLWLVVGVGKGGERGGKWLWLMGEVEDGVWQLWRCIENLKTQKLRLSVLRRFLCI